MWTLRHFFIHPDHAFPSQIQDSGLKLLTTPLALHIHDLGRDEPVLLTQTKQIIEVGVQLDRHSADVLVVDNGNIAEDGSLVYSPDYVIS